MQYPRWLRFSLCAISSGYPRTLRSDWQSANSMLSRRQSISQGFEVAKELSGSSCAPVRKSLTDDLILQGNRERINYGTSGASLQPCFFQQLWSYKHHQIVALNALWKRTNLRQEIELPLFFLSVSLLGCVYRRRAETIHLLLTVFDIRIVRPYSEK